MCYSHNIIKLLCFYFLLIPNLDSAQVIISGGPSPSPKPINTPEKLAMQYFEQKEYEKANEYFNDLYNKNPEGWYHYYYKSLLGAKEYHKAEKITKKQLRNNSYNVYLYVYLGRIYNALNDEKREKEAYERAVKELTAIQPDIQNLANAFIENHLYEYAIQAYNKGRRTTPDYPYFYERAEVYKAMNNISGMINEYLDALEFRETE